MGYTHYYYVKPELDTKKFGKFASDCKKIVECAKADGIAIGDGMGEGGDPKITDGAVSLNGVGDEAHETFAVAPGGGYSSSKDDAGRVFNFTKTARKPYDDVVTACLIALKHHFGDDVAIHSDGDEGEWYPGKQLCQRACGYGDGVTILDRED